MILHIDMDAFFASIEQAINPRLKGRPLIVGSRANRLHTVVCAASYEAKAKGIDSGMPTTEAFKICPDLEFVAADQGRYIWTSEQIFQLLEGYGFGAVYASIDEFQMDIGSHPDPKNLAEDIRKQIQKTFNVTASIGVAKNWLLAKLASKLNKPNGIAILTAENLEEVLRVVPVAKLCGVGAKTQAMLEALEIKTCLDLYRKPPQFLEQIFSQNGLNLYLSLHSIDCFGLNQQEEKPKSIGHSYTLSRASENTGFIQGWLRLLSEMVARRLRQKNMAAATIHLWLSGPEMPGFGAQKTYSEPTNDGYEIYQKAVKIMARIDPKTPKIRALGVTASSLSQIRYPPLFNNQKRREDLLKAIDHINSRQGEWAIYPATIALAQPKK